MTRTEDKVEIEVNEEEKEELPAESEKEAESLIKADAVQIPDREEDIDQNQITSPLSSKTSK